MGLGEHASKSRQHLSYTATGKHFRSEVTFSRNRLGAGDLGASEKSLHLAVFHLLVVQKSFQEYHDLCHVNHVSPLSPPAPARRAFVRTSSWAVRVGFFELTTRRRPWPRLARGNPSIIGIRHLIKTTQIITVRWLYVLM